MFMAKLREKKHGKFKWILFFSFSKRDKELKGLFSSGTEFEIIFQPLGNCIIFEIKYNFVILELIGQPFFLFKAK